MGEIEFMIDEIKILEKATCIPAVDLEFGNEVPIIRPSEALEAMREYGKVYLKEYFKKQFYNALEIAFQEGRVGPSKSFKDWMDRCMTEGDTVDFLQEKIEKIRIEKEQTLKNKIAHQIHCHTKSGESLTDTVDRIVNLTKKANLQPV